MNQHLEALALGNEIRMKRAAYRREVEAGMEGLTDLLNRREERWLKNAKVGMILTWPRRAGRVTAAKVLGYTHISETRRVGTLTDREVGILLAAVERVRPAALNGGGV